jgi:raffinose/stachyose/melibiose transport system permease protein
VKLLHPSIRAESISSDNAFQLNDIGYGAAISVFLAVIIALCSIGYLKFVERSD